MACTQPKTAYKYGLTDNGKTKLVFKRPEYFQPTDENTQQIPCGKCISCKLSYAKEWALRITHESTCHRYNSFITLTYNDENLPENKSVSRQEVKNFIKRLRKYITTHYPEHEKIKTFYCGEYGAQKSRPHYHIIVLGWDFPDKTYQKISPTGSTLWESQILHNLWLNKQRQSKGFTNIGEVTFESAGYIARYCFKKQKDKKNYSFVDGYDETTGEIHSIRQLTPEFIGMSQGIGKTWYNEFKSDTYKDYLQTNGFKHKIPRYYDKQLEKINPQLLEQTKIKRQEKAKTNKAETTKPRLLAKNEVKKAQLKQLNRTYEND